jgi:hypothetical protein
MILHIIHKILNEFNGVIKKMNIITNEMVVQLDTNLVSLEYFENV